MSVLEKSFYVGGVWRTGGEVTSVKSPWDGTTVGNVANAGLTDARDAVDKALLGFERTKTLSSHERAEILSSIAAKIKEQKEDFAALITAEVGKPMLFSRLEVDRAILTFQLASEEAKRIEGNVVPLDLIGATKNRFGITRRFA